jgi:hypothetical protein
VKIDAISCRVSDSEVIVEILRVFEKIDRKIKHNGFDVQKTIEPSKSNFLLVVRKKLDFLVM